LYRTGDLAAWQENGNIEYFGRIDQQVKIRGFRIELAEIEKQLENHSLVKEAVVDIRTGKNTEKYLCAYVVTYGNNPGQQDVETLRGDLAETLPEYMLPSYMIPIPAIPLTTNGKIDRKALPRVEHHPGTTFAPPQDAWQLKLTAIWEDVLEIEKGAISINDDFFRLG
ncbi:MAG: amino acid adenylation domain-containing protein, partial [bacterium]|nr:amino acid adenylation domain-containing protein [bacterium]